MGARAGSLLCFILLLGIIEVVIAVFIEQLLKNKNAQAWEFSPYAPSPMNSSSQLENIENRCRWPGNTTDLLLLYRVASHCVF